VDVDVIVRGNSELSVGSAAAEETTHFDHIGPFSVENRPFGRNAPLYARESDGYDLEQTALYQ